MECALAHPARAALTDASPADVAATAEAVAALLVATGPRAKRLAATPGGPALFDALLLVVAEAARRQVAPEHLDEALGDAGVPPAVREPILAVVEAHGPAIAAHHDRHSTSALSRCSGVTWTVGHELGDRVTDPAAPTRSLPVAKVRLAATGGPVEFEATAEQLQDLVARLRDAVGAAERLTE